MRHPAPLLFAAFLLALAPAAPRAVDPPADADAAGLDATDATPAPDAEPDHAPPAPPPAAEAPAPAPDTTERPALVTVPSRMLRLDPRRLVPHYEFLEDSYLDYFFPNVGPAKDRPLFIDAQAALHLFLWNQWARVQEPKERGGWLLVNNLGVSFLLHLRMVQEFSAPVRPPSYIPRIDYQLFAIRRSHPDLVDLFELRLTPWGHHSNGQQGCQFANDVAQGNPSPSDCVVPNTAHPDPAQVNFRSGDFSTSFFVVGGHYARIGLDPARWTKWRWGLGALFEGNPRPWGPGTIDVFNAKMYGQWRVKLEAELRYHFDDPLGMRFLRGMGAITASGQLMWPVPRPIPGHREIVEVTYQPDDFRGAGAFVRYFSGQDDLNVLYAVGRTEYVAVGIVWTSSPQVQYTFGGVP